jgi:signal peptidase I
VAIYIGGILLATFLIVNFVAQRTRVYGYSMTPTLNDADQLIVEKLSYHFTDPQRYDIIVFPYQYAKNTFYVKRIIGLPGERIRIDYDGNIYINGKVLEEHYGKEVIEDPGIAATEIQLADDEYFLLGDNRNNSQDSRDPSVGPVKRKNLIGRVWLRLYPFSKFGLITHQ